MTTLSALRDGIRRVNAAPAVMFGVLLLTFLLALPLGVVLHGMIRESLGDSLAAGAAATGVNSEWWQEFESQATGVGLAFTPRIIGFGAVLANLNSLVDGHPQVPAVAGAAVAYLLVWTFLAGGILDRYARNRAVRTAAFFSACGIFFFRFLRLLVIVVVAYGLLYRFLYSWLFLSFYPWMTHDWVVEQNAFFLRVALYVVFASALIAVNLLFDYAKARAVVEDRRSMIGAVLASFRFVRRHPGQTIGLYLIDGVLFGIVVLLYGLAAPGAGSIGWSMWAGLIVSELYLLARLWVRLVFSASEVALFQGLVAHAEYTAAPIPSWPESPAAEAIRPGAGDKLEKGAGC
ncbi:MAG TPA: hypothetical protein VGK32_16195 [Vicinamibacterales bacterium]|jgi:hypothetical protein